MDTVNEHATFNQNDVFHRLDFVRQAMNIVQQHKAEKGACVISIDASWGAGKTTLLRMWINELEQGADSHIKEFQIENECIYYNAWENDYYGHALIPLMYSICADLAIKSKNTAKWKNKLKELVDSLIANASRAVASFVSYSGTNNSIVASSAGEAAVITTQTVMHLLRANNSEEIAKQFKDELEIREAFRSELVRIADTVGKLFIFIDELDRCKPIFAIQTLEAIKHYFNIPNIVFVFATDLTQLAHTLEGVYGPGLDAGGYFSKFFDYQMHMPDPNIQDLLNYTNDGASADDETYNTLNEIRNIFGLTPREMPTLIQQTNTIWAICKADKRKLKVSICYVFIFFLLSMKRKLISRYKDILVSNNIWPETITNSENDIIQQIVQFISQNRHRSMYDLQEEKTNLEIHPYRITTETKTNDVIVHNLLISITSSMCPSAAVSQTVGQALLETLEIYGTNQFR